MKIVINKCYGGFGLSNEAEDLYAKKKVMGKLYRYVQTEYEHREGKDKYVRATGVERFTHVFKKDHGDSFSEMPDDDSYIYIGGGVDRDDPILVEVVEELGEEKASSELAELKVVEIPDGTSYTIEEYDGVEWVAETHQTWG